MVLLFLDFCNVIIVTLESIVSWNNNNLRTESILNMKYQSRFVYWVENNLSSR